MSRTALLAGATGLVGSHVLNLLLGDPAWSRVVTVGRRTTPQQHAKLEQRVLDLGELETVRDLPHVDDVFCCLGTTIERAGSQPAFRRSTQIFRPSLLLGERREFRLGERIAMLGAPVLSVALFGRLRRYRPIRVGTVAQAMVNLAREAPLGPNVFEYDAMLASARA